MPDATRNSLRPQTARCAAAHLALLGLLAAGLPARSAGATKRTRPSPKIQVPSGFDVELVARNIGPLRHIVARGNGDIYGNLRRMHRGGSLVALRDTTGDGRLDTSTYFERHPGTGIAIHAERLYFSDRTQVYRKAWKGDELVPSGPTRIVVRNLPKQRSHAAKSLAIDPSAGHLYVNIGAPANACQKQRRTPGSPGLRPCPLLRRHGGIWRFSAAQRRQSQTDGVRFATGLRNVVALAFNPAVGALYGVQHGRDQLHTLWPKHFTQKESARLPAEEMFLLRRGTNGGWPYTYWDQRREARMLAPEYGGNGSKKAPAGKYAEPIVAFPGHYAPNGLVFYSGEQFPERYRGGAFVAFHGSWNRSPLPQRGYQVYFVPFAGKRPAGEPKLFADGFAGTDTIAHPSDAAHRPMGLAVGPGGSLYVSDSQKGHIWRIRWQSKAHASPDKSPK